MKTIVNGVEITPQMANVLHEWYNGVFFEDMPPVQYAKKLSKIQDYLTRLLVDNTDNTEEDILELKKCISCLLQIRDDMEMFIPPNKNKARETD
jgi:hypothetical protein